jgi:hypothetical protein
MNDELSEDEEVLLMASGGGGPDGGNAFGYLLFLGVPWGLLCLIAWLQSITA